MKLSKWSAVVGALGVGILSLTGCEVSQLYGASCSTSPPVPHQDPGVVSATVDVPPKVHPSDTFTIKVKGIGVAGGAAENPPPAAGGSITVTGGGTPNGPTGWGSWLSPTTWPQSVDVTVTGQVGETIEVGVAGGEVFVGTFPNGYVLSCSPFGDGHLATIQIVAP
jgi:hypothetical protein